MPRITEEIVINRSIEKAFNEMMTLEFMKKIDPVAFSNKTEILFQNERLLRFVSKGTPSGDVEMERVTIPESFTIVTLRRPPLAPFLYQLSIKILSEYKDGTLVKQINEFELDENNKPKEGVIVSIIRNNDIHNLQETKNYFSDWNQ